MAQFARPDADTTIGNFVDAADGVTNIFQSIDETSASDADYIKSPASPVNEVYVCRLSDVTDPVSSSNHVMRMRTSCDQAAQETPSPSLRTPTRLSKSTAHSAQGH